MSVLVIGIGNQFRSDDAVGLQIADSLSELNISDISIQRSAGEGIALINLWEDFDHVILVDAVKSESSIGTIHKLNLLEDELKSDWFQTSSHLFALPEAVQLAKTLDKIPKTMLVYGIEGENFEYGIEISQKVAEAKVKLIEIIKTEIDKLLEQTEGHNA